MNYLFNTHFVKLLVLKIEKMRIDYIILYFMAYIFEDYSRFHGGLMNC